MSIDREKLALLFSNQQREGCLNSFAEELNTDLPFDVFHVHNVGDVTLPMQSNVFHQIKACYHKMPIQGICFDSTSCIVDGKCLASCNGTGFTTKAFSKLAKLYLQNMLQILLDNVLIELDAHVDSLVLLHGHGQTCTLFKLLNQKSRPGSFGYMLLKLPTEGDAGQTTVTVTYKEQIKHHELGKHPSVFMVSAPCRKHHKQNFRITQSSNSQAAFLVVSLIWKNVHALNQLLRPSDLPVFLRETWQVDEALCSWRSSKAAEEQIGPPSCTPDFLCIPLFHNYPINDFNLNTLRGIDLLNARRLMSLDYLQVHLAAVSEQTKAVGELTYCYRLMWISSVGTWKAPPTAAWADRHLIGLPTAKMYFMKEPGRQVALLLPIQHPVLLIRLKWTAIPEKIDFGEAFADLRNRLPDALKELVSKQTLSDDDRFVTDFKLLVSFVGSAGNSNNVTSRELLVLLEMANDLHRFDEGLDILKILATRKCSSEDESGPIAAMSDLIINIGWERCSEPILQMLDNSEGFVSFVCVATDLFCNAYFRATMQLTPKIIEKMSVRGGSPAIAIGNMASLYLAFRRYFEPDRSEAVYRLLLEALKKSRLADLWNGLKILKKNSLRNELALEHIPRILIDIGDSFANAQLDNISEPWFVDILNEYEAVNDGNKVVDCLWRSAFRESETSIEEKRRAPMMQRLILYFKTDQERSSFLKKISTYPEASAALDNIVNLSVVEHTRNETEQSAGVFLKIFHVVVMAEEHEVLRSSKRLKLMRTWFSSSRRARENVLPAPRESSQMNTRVSENAPPPGKKLKKSDV